MKKGKFMDKVADRLEERLENAGVSDDYTIDWEDDELELNVYSDDGGFDETYNFSREYEVHEAEDLKVSEVVARKLDSIMDSIRERELDMEWTDEELEEEGEEEENDFFSEAGDEPAGYFTLMDAGAAVGFERLELPGGVALAVFEMHNGSPVMVTGNAILPESDRAREVQRNTVAAQGGAPLVIATYTDVLREAAEVTGVERSPEMLPSYASDAIVIRGGNAPENTPAAHTGLSLLALGCDEETRALREVAGRDPQGRVLLIPEESDIVVAVPAHLIGPGLFEELEGFVCAQTAHLPRTDRLCSHLLAWSEETGLIAASDMPELARGAGNADPELDAEEEDELEEDDELEEEEAEDFFNDARGVGDFAEDDMTLSEFSQAVASAVSYRLQRDEPGLAEVWVVARPVRVALVHPDGLEFASFDVERAYDEWNSNSLSFDDTTDGLVGEIVAAAVAGAAERTVPPCEVEIPGGEEEVPLD